MTLRGTQQGPIGPYPATGKEVTVKFLGIMRLVDGKVAEIWVEWDNLNILTQLGHFPPPADE
jgi:predicted ester cyclase